MHMRDGVMTASFQTTNDEATKVLSHSLGQLKTVARIAGRERREAPRAAVVAARPAAGAGRDDQNPREQNPHDHPGRQEQQRSEMLRRMWRRLSGGQDPLDIVA